MAAKGVEVFAIDCMTVTKAQLQSLRSSFSFSSMVSGEYINGGSSRWAPFSLCACSHSTHSLTRPRAAPLNGFAGWFDVVFRNGDSDGGELLRLSTGPESVGTHWCQSLFYLDEGVVVQQGQQIAGEITVTNNGLGKRSTAVTITVTIDAKTMTTKTFEIRFA
jgi:hypothetical protein